MKLNVGGLIVNESDAIVDSKNRSFTHGDAVKEVFRVVNGEIIDWEDHYFNLMASMRIFRMNIPLSFTPEFFQDQVILVIEANAIQNGKITFMVFRNHHENLTKANIDFIIKTEPSVNSWEYFSDSAEIDVFKDFTVNKSFYSQVNSHQSEEVIAEIYRLENDYADIILLNADKRMARTLKGSIFIINGNIIKTPKQEEGVLRSVLRNNFIKKISAEGNYVIEEQEIFPFEIQKADEVFVLIDGFGIQSITQSRKKIYQTAITEQLYKTYF